ncbi:MAG: flavodoxin family protein [Deltaproteobacteria bacterium]|nr:flavodoxin family protein [Deltaproteobacteria bacterium]
MKIMAFVGSPRKGGNTDILIDKVIEGAKSKAEVEVEKIYLYEANIKYCNGCGLHTVLKGSKECPLDDDMKGILKRMEQADAFILGSPNHGRTISAAMTNFIARMMPLLKMEVIRDDAGNIIDGVQKPLVKGKKAVMVVSQGDPWATSSSLVLKILDDNIKDFQMKKVGEVFSMFNLEKGAVREQLRRRRQIWIWRLLRE